VRAKRKRNRVCEQENCAGEFSLSQGRIRVPIGNEDIICLHPQLPQAPETMSDQPHPAIAAVAFGVTAPGIVFGLIRAGVT
jgi:hypothetical protein